MEHDDNTSTHVVLAAGTMVQHYRIVEKIGAGGMGEVYLAEDTRLQRKVALKFLPMHLTGNEEIKSRFQREAQAVAKLNHPHIVTIHEVSEYNGRPFFVMEHIEGKSLHHFAHKETLPIEAIIDFAIQLCQGLGEAHRNGITHRDIKADNIAVDNSNRIRLLDFGLAAIEGDKKLTRTGSTMGTVAYMSPEQVSGRDVDQRSDLFSLGIVLYELIAGRTPFRRDSEGATLKAIIEDEPEPLMRYRAKVPEKLQAIVDKLLEKDKEVRYQTAEGVIADLKKLLYDSQPSQFNRRPVTRKSKRPLYVAVAALVVIIAAAVYLYERPFGTSNDDHVPVLAVLPFENLGSANDEYFAEGISDEIRSRLTTIDGVRVISRSSAQKYKGSDKTFEQIGRELGADYLLGATIRWDKSGPVERIRITPQLTKTENNFQLWSESYQRDLTQIFDVQAEIAQRIVDQLGLTFHSPDEVKQANSPTTSMEAYNYYLKGMEMQREGIYIGPIKDAVQMYDSALMLDPGFAMAWARKSIACTDVAFSAPQEHGGYYRTEALRSAQKALELDPSLAIGHIALGSYYNFIETDYDNALSEFSKAESETSSNAELSENIGIVKMRQGKWGEALTYFEKAAQIDPLDDSRYFWLATCNALVRDYSSARSYISRSLALSPNNVDANYSAVFIDLLEYGRISDAVMSRLRKLDQSTLAATFSWEVGSGDAFGLWRLVPSELYPDDKETVLRSFGGELSPQAMYLNLAELYSLEGPADKEGLYLDSARIQLAKLGGVQSADWDVVADMGLVYARTGKFEEAIKAGEKAKEMMSIDDCHW